MSYIASFFISKSYCSISIWCWYLRTMLVFSFHTGIYAWCWYLCLIPVFNFHTDIYTRCWYTNAQNNKSIKFLVLHTWYQCLHQYLTVSCHWIIIKDHSSCRHGPQCGLYWITEGSEWAISVAILRAVDQPWSTDLTAFCNPIEPTPTEGGILCNDTATMNCYILTRVLISSVQ